MVDAEIDSKKTSKQSQCCSRPKKDVEVWYMAESTQKRCQNRVNAAVNSKKMSKYGGCQNRLKKDVKIGSKQTSTINRRLIWVEKTDRLKKNILITHLRLIYGRYCNPLKKDLISTVDCVLRDCQLYAIFSCARVTPFFYIHVR